MLAATGRYNRPLTTERLFGWHASLFAAGRSGIHKIRVGAWRDDNTGPMQVVSGPVGKEHVHFQAPPANRLDREMHVFLDWFNTGADIDPISKAAMAHLWFVTIHPFDDGNGRIARTIADMALARSEDSPQRFYTMSGQIRQERAGWMEWFLGCLGRAVDASQTILGAVLAKAHFWQSLQRVILNQRQTLVLNRLGLEGKLTTSKYARLTKCSQDTALRDIAALVDRGVLMRNPEGGRSASYSLA